jgi:TRAP-type C4-dicarboxylate transport system substrate-binding protein
MTVAYQKLPFDEAIQFLKYKVNPPWWIGTDTALMNAQSWDRLPPDLKQVLQDTMKEVERETPEYYVKKAKEEEAQLVQAGMKIIELPAAEIAKIKRIHWEEGTKSFLLGPSPKYGPKLRDLMARFAPR